MLVFLACQKGVLRFGTQPGQRALGVTRGLLSPLEPLEGIRGPFTASLHSPNKSLDMTWRARYTSCSSGMAFLHNLSLFREKALHWGVPVSVSPLWEEL